MHGLIIRSFEGFLRNTYGDALWGDIVNGLGPNHEHFEPLFHYDDAQAHGLIDRAAHHLGKSRDTMLEDFGTYLVAHPASQRVRRLLRFGGADYEDFLGSLEDLAGRARLAVPDLVLPDLKLRDLGGGLFHLSLDSPFDGAAFVYLGLLRALADDYGALVLLDIEESDAQNGAVPDQISIRLLKADFTEGRGFDLADGGSANAPGQP